MKYAFETLEIEKHRLLRAIREMRSLPVSSDDFPLERIKEHTELIAELDHAIATLKSGVEEAQRRPEAAYERWKEENAKLIADYRKRKDEPNQNEPSE
jgi:hypothetical protein